MTPKTVHEIMAEQRKTRSADIEIALQDFMELTHAEQMEFIFVGLLMTVRQTEWAQNAVVSLLKSRGE